MTLADYLSGRGQPPKPSDLPSITRKDSTKCQQSVPLLGAALNYVMHQPAPPRPQLVRRLPPPIL